MVFDHASVELLFRDQTKSTQMKTNSPEKFGNVILNRTVQWACIHASNKAQTTATAALEL